MNKLIENLKKKEALAIASVLAFMSYNSSIVRVLERNGVKSFQKMVEDKIKLLSSINTVQQFDKFHSKWIIEFISKIRTHKYKKCSVGQAQKAINVYLKLYVDWAHLPNNTVSKKIVPFLHVPLDSILMNYIRKNFKKIYHEKIIPIKNNKKSMSLSQININEYLGWQKIFREYCPEKPLFFDIIWATQRN